MEGARVVMEAGEGATITASIRLVAERLSAVELQRCIDTCIEWQEALTAKDLAAVWALAASRHGLVFVDADGVPTKPLPLIIARGLRFWTALSRRFLQDNNENLEDLPFATTVSVADSTPRPRTIQCDVCGCGAEHQPASPGDKMSHSQSVLWTHGAFVHRFDMIKARSKGRPAAVFEMEFVPPSGSSPSVAEYLFPAVL